MRTAIAFGTQLRGCMAYSGERLRELRQQRNLTLQDIANLMGVTYQAVRSWETTDKPNVDRLTELCRILECSSDYLLGLVEKPDQRVIMENLTSDEKALIQLYRTTFRRHIGRFAGKTKLISEESEE